MSDSLVLIPTYNEKENIANIIAAVFALEKAFHILVIDDGSPDGTAQIVKELQQSHPDALFLEERSGKLGLGTAYIHGFKWGLARHYDYILKWMPIFRTHPKICFAYMPHVANRKTMLLSALAT